MVYDIPYGMLAGSAKVTNMIQAEVIPPVFQEVFAYRPLSAHDRQQMTNPKTGRNENLLRAESTLLAAIDLWIASTQAAEGDLRAPGDTRPTPAFSDAIRAAAAEVRAAASASGPLRDDGRTRKLMHGALTLAARLDQIQRTSRSPRSAELLPSDSTAARSAAIVEFDAALRSIADASDALHSLAYASLLAEMAVRLGVSFEEAQRQEATRWK